MQKSKEDERDIVMKISDFLVKRGYLVPIVLVPFIVILVLTYTVVDYYLTAIYERRDTIQQATLKYVTYNEYGLVGRQTLSDTLLYEIDDIYIYSERAVPKLSIGLGSASSLGKRVNGLVKKTDESVRITVLPVPMRVMYEPVSGHSNALFNNFVNSLNRNSHVRVKVVNCAEDLRGNGGRNLFYRTDRDWTMPGAYYGYASFLTAIGKEPYPEDHFVLYQNNGLHGDVYRHLRRNEDEDIRDLVGSYPEDPFFYRLAREAKNYEDVKGSDGVFYKRPLVSYVIASSGCVVGNEIDYAIIPGNGEGTIVVIGDNNGKLIAPYLAENYETVIVMDIQRYRGEDYEKVIAGYDVTDILIAQSVEHMGVRSYSRLLNSFLE